jgi:hypothetical protein
MTSLYSERYNSIPKALPFRFATLKPAIKYICKYHINRRWYYKLLSLVIANLNNKEGRKRYNFRFLRKIVRSNRRQRVYLWRHRKRSFFLSQHMQKKKKLYLKKKSEKRASIDASSIK